MRRNRWLVSRRYHWPLALALLLLPTAGATVQADDQSESIDLSVIFNGKAPAGLAELRAMESHVQELSERVIPATVGVRVGAAQGSGRGD